MRRWFVEGFTTLLWSLSMTGWLESGCGWPQEQPHQKVFHSGWSVIVSVPCHIWRLSRPAPGQVSPPHPARYQTLETNRGKRKRWVSVNKFQSQERNTTVWWFSSWKAFFRVNMVKLPPHELMLLMLAWQKIKGNYKCFFSLIKIPLIRDSNFPFSHSSYIVCVFTTETSTDKAKAWLKWQIFEWNFVGLFHEEPAVPNSLWKVSYFYVSLLIS